ncbi:GtrA family protein [Planctomonas sp. JC2975]|uniref:GtrA family protein n=1 Tax=Planctomonas sp. JC2975 TaxID=2729626 RepID=UPI001472D834|nr:GtrA family protein [Planctomonas sp. JC2975]NNC13046.1 GtrA family protein [Planctomonas sp. JC2975]
MSDRDPDAASASSGGNISPGATSADANAASGGSVPARGTSSLRRVRQRIIDSRLLLQNRAIVRYLVVGGLSFVIDFGLLALFEEVFHWQTWIATAVAFLLSVIFNYIAQRTYSFDSNTPHGKTLVRYVILLAFNTVATSVIVSLGAKTPLTWAGAKIVATGMTTLWNYFVFKYWIFASRRLRS